ncbi:MAG TPA: hypothetical protein VMV77_15105 [Bacteroidales bacterium]|nr:hypothetical protein [Bacteroidales bacterium]
MADMHNSLDKSKNKMHGFEQKMAKMKKVMGGVTKTIFSLKGALLSLGLGLVAKSFVSAASTAEQYRVRLEVLLGSVSEASRMFKDMTEYAAKVPHTYQDIMGAATSLSGVMRGGVDEVKRYMPMIGDLAAVTGLSLQETTGQVIRMYSAGAASADMFRERGILAMMGFKAGVHYSMEDTRKMMFESWEKTDSQFRGATDKLGKTWKGLTSMLSDRWFQVRNKVMEAGIFDYIKEKMDLAIKKIDEFVESGKLDIWADKIGKKVVAAFEFLKKAIGFVVENWRALIVVSTTFLSLKLVLFVSKLAQNFQDLGVAIGVLTKVNVAITATGTAAAASTIHLNSLSGAFTVLAAKIAAAGIVVKTGLAAIFFWIGWKIGEKLDKTFVIVEKFGITVAKALRFAFEKAAFEIKALLGTVQLEALKAWNWAKEIYENIKKLPGRIWSGEQGPQFTPVYWDEEILKQKLEIQRNQFRKHLEEIEIMYQKMMKVAGTDVPWWVDMETVDMLPFLQAKGMGYGNLENISKAMGELKEKAPTIWDDFTAQLPVIAESISDVIGGALSDLMVGLDADFGELGLSIARTFANKFSSVMVNKWIDPITDKIMEGTASWWQSALMYSSMGYGMGGTSGAIGSAVGGWFGGSVIGSAFGGPIGALAGGLLGGLFGDDDEPQGPTLAERYDAQMERLEGIEKQKIKELETDMTNSFSSAIGQGFLDSLQTGEYQSFKDTLSMGLATMVQDAVIQMFTTAAMQPLFDLMQPAFDLQANYQYQTQNPEDYAKQVQEAKEYQGMMDFLPDKSVFGSKLSVRDAFTTMWLQSGKAISAPDAVTENQWLDEMSSIIEGFPQYMEELQPLFDTFTEGLTGLNTSIEENTGAVLGNTSAILGPVESFLRELTVGQYAPALSLEGMQAEYAKLYEKAYFDPEAFGDFASFAGSGYLDFMKAYGDYDIAHAGVVSGTQAFPWFQEALAKQAEEEQQSFNIQNEITLNNNITFEFEGQALGHVIAQSALNTDEFHTVIKTIVQEEIAQGN